MEKFGEMFATIKIERESNKEYDKLRSTVNVINNLRSRHGSFIGACISTFDLEKRLESIKSFSETNTKNNVKLNSLQLIATAITIQSKIKDFSEILESQVASEIPIPNPVVVSYNCSICKKEYADAKLLLLHLDEHNTDKSTRNSKKMECDFCGYSTAY